MNALPWELHEQLTEERLVEIAAAIRDVRHESLDGHEPDKGDTGWGLGCRAYERTCYALTLLADQCDWLRILPTDKQFVFTVGGVPMRFYRGEPERPQQRWLKRSYPELQQQQFAFANSDHYEWFWRVVIETDFDGSVLRIVYVQVADSGLVQNPWGAPLDASVSVLASLRPTEAEEVEIAPPLVAPKSAARKMKSGTND